MTSYGTAPRNVRALTDRLTNVTGSRVAGELLRRAVACVVVGQMLPDGVVKGGAAMRIRMGTDTSRFSRDLDVAGHGEVRDFVEDLQQRLRTGWAGFTGRVVTLDPPRPAGVPAVYVMRPFEVKLEYADRPWLTLPLDLGHDEIGDTDRPEPHLADDLVALFHDLGLPVPRPIALLSVEDQVAQKLHACSAPGSDRAHDLVDLQLLDSFADIDLPRAAGLCRRLFASRRDHAWPPAVVLAGLPCTQRPVTDCPYFRMSTRRSTGVTTSSPASTQRSNNHNRHVAGVDTDRLVAGRAEIGDVGLL